MKKIVILILSLFILFSCWKNEKYTEEYCNQCYISYFWGKWIVCFDKKITESEKKNIEKNCNLKTVQ